MVISCRSEKNGISTSVLALLIVLGKLNNVTAAVHFNYFPEMYL